MSLRFGWGVGAALLALDELFAADGHPLASRWGKEDVPQPVDVCPDVARRAIAP